MKLKNKKHEAFAEAVADGSAATIAYRECVSSAGTYATSANNAYALLKRSDVSARVSELRDKSEDILEGQLGFSKKSMLRLLLAIVHTPATDLRKSHLLERWSKTRDGERMGMPSKMEALALICKIVGWEAPTKSQMELKGLPPWSAIVEKAKGFTGIPRDGKHARK